MSRLFAARGVSVGAPFAGESGLPHRGDARTLHTTAIMENAHGPAVGVTPEHARASGSLRVHWVTSIAQCRYACAMQHAEALWTHPVGSLWCGRLMAHAGRAHVRVFCVVGAPGWW